MSITYEGSFLKTLFRWHGSVWKYIWREALIWVILFYSIRIVFLNVVIHSSESGHMKNVVEQFDAYLKYIPLEFLLGFYVNLLVSRWWNQAMLISSPHDIMGTVAAFVHESDEDSERVRHSIARYLILYCTLGYRNVSSKLRKLFPTNECFVKIGLITQEECEILDVVPRGIAHEISYQWIIELVRRKVGNQVSILRLLNEHRSLMKQLAKYNDLPVPLVYTQTVTIAVYGYFTFALIGHQFHNEKNVDLYFPFFTMLRFIFSVGWLKVAQYLEKPFGNDDDDIDLCSYLSRYCANVFAVANSPNKFPEKSCNIQEFQGENLRKVFEAEVTHYEEISEVISEKFNHVLIYTNY